MLKPDVEILQYLVDRNLLTFQKANDIRDTLEKGSTLSLEQLLVENKIVDEDVLYQAKAAALKFPYVNLKDITVPKDVLTIIPESTARGHLIVAFANGEQGLQVAMADPNDRQIVEFIHKKVNVPITISLASPSAIRNTLAQYQETLSSELQTLITQARGTLSGSSDAAQAEDLPVLKITESIFKHAILQGASDIHIEPTESELIIRYRIDGILHSVLTLPKLLAAGIVARIKVLSNLKIDEHRLPQDGRFKMENDDYRVAFRVSTLPVYDGEKVVMRLLDETGQGLGLSDIGMSEHALLAFRNNIAKPHGMVLVTGPTGSGKTTTLYAALREINTPEVNISTVEDPIEYRMENINQTQVQPKIGLTFSTGLRSLVRQDPDIIMVGEIRDEETASLAVNAALTGHLVFSTLHTNSAAGAVPRLIDMNVEPFLIASTINVLLAQRLVRKLCVDCKEKTTFDKIVLESLANVMDIGKMLETLQREKIIQKKTEWKDIAMYRSGTCSKCTGGYRGRLGIYEILEVTDKIQGLITSNVTSTQIQDVAKEEQHMVTMLEDGMIKVIQGATSVEEILRVAKE